MSVMADQLCLKWTDFHSSIVNALDSLKCSEDLVDVTLTCEGQSIKAHKVILSACSPYFRGVFKENPCQHPIIIFKDVLAGDMSRLLEYMYQGEVTVQEEQLPALLQTAQLLQVSGLTAYTVSPQSKNIQQKTLTSSPNHSKKVTSHLVSVKKPPPIYINQPKDLLQSNTAKSAAVFQNKKRRNSASEKVTESLLDQEKKSKPSKEKSVSNSSKKSESTSCTDTKIDNSLKDKTAGGNKDESLPLPLSTQETADMQTNQPDGSDFLATVKHELVDEEERDENLIVDETERDSSPNSPPFYETSMLARSLLSGTHSLKSYTSQGSSAVGKSKSSQSSGETVGVEVKGERLSPGGDGLEPEILIAEEEVRGGAGPPANHAAICGDCPHCGTQYSNQSALKYHVRLMHSDLTNRLCCYLCPRSFTVRDTFKEHMWTFHGQRN